MTATPRPISVERIREAARVIDPALLGTPVRTSDRLDAEIGARVLLKDESANPIRSFKGRGSDFLVKRGLAPGEPLVCASAGNFGQGLARAGTSGGHKVTVFAATTASPIKIARMRELGAEVVLEGADFDAANAAARAHARRTGARYVEDCDIPEVAEGAGTIALEITEAGHRPGAVFVPVGGGALANGIGLWLKASLPGCRVIGVGAAGAPALCRSWHEHRLVTLERVETIADGVAVRAPVAYAMDHLAKSLDEFVLVDDTEILAAMRLVRDTAGLEIEPAAATVVAAMRQRHGRLPEVVAAPISGANLTDEQRRRWLG